MGIEVRKRKRSLGAHTAFAAAAMASHLRPKYLPKAPPCTLTCLIHTDVRGYLTTIAQSELYGRSYEESLEEGWHILTDKNPFPAVCGRVCPHPCEAECNRREKEISTAADYLILILLIGILLTGDYMRFFTHFDLQETHDYFLGLLTFTPQLPQSNVFFFHFLLLPFSAGADPAHVRPFQQDNALRRDLFLPNPGSKEVKRDGYGCRERACLEEDQGPQRWPSRHASLHGDLCQVRHLLSPVPYLAGLGRASFEPGRAGRPDPGPLQEVQHHRREILRRTGGRQRAHRRGAGGLGEGALRVHGMPPVRPVLPLRDRQLGHPADRPGHPERAERTPKELMRTMEASAQTGNNDGAAPEALMASVRFMEEELQDETGIAIRIPVDQSGAEILLVPPSADCLTLPESMMGCAKVFHQLNIPWTLNSKAFDCANFGLFTGDDAAMKAKNKLMVEAAKALGVKKLIIGECGHAYRVMKRMASAWYDQIPFQISSILEETACYIREGKLQLDRSKNPEPVTYHDPCNFSRSVGVAEEPREILRAVCQDFREMTPNRSDNWCCGGGGLAVMESIKEFRMTVTGKNKVDQIRATGAQYVAAPCANCKRQIKELVEYHQMDVQVGGVHDLVGKAIQVTRR